MNVDNSKIRLVLDIDDTAINSSEQMVKMINKQYGTNKTIKDLKDYAYKSICRNISEEMKYNMFDSIEFFKNVKFKEGFLECCEAFKDEVTFEFLTKGRKLNLTAKYDWMNRYFPYDFGYYGISCDNTKGHNDLSNAVFIEDVTQNLLESNAKVKILIRNNRETEYNRIEPNSGIYAVDNWEQIHTMLDFIIHKDRSNFF